MLIICDNRKNIGIKNMIFHKEYIKFLSYSVLKGGAGIHFHDGYNICKCAYKVAQSYL